MYVDQNISLPRGDLLMKPASLSDARRGNDPSVGLKLVLLQPYLMPLPFCKMLQ
jgi:hypothetical protein